MLGYQPTQPILPTPQKKVTIKTTKLLGKKPKWLHLLFFYLALIILILPIISN